jgi:NUMOD3 motif
VQTSLRKFYVYEHWRPDQDICFWVGKGCGKRAYVFKRNRHYNSIVAKLHRLGMCVEVRLVASGLLESEALAIEVKQILFWQGVGMKLANKTYGGGGVSGLKHTSAAKKKISAAFLGKPLSREHVAKIIAANRKNRKPRPPLSKRARLRISNASRGNTYALGYRHTEEAKMKISNAGRGRIFSARRRALIGLSKIGNKNCLGRICKEETKRKISIAQLGKPRFNTEQKAHLSAIRKGRPWTLARRAAQDRKKILETLL